MRMEYEVAEHELGKVLVAGTEKGVSFLALGDDEAPMLQELAHDYPGAEIVKLRGSGARWMPLVLDAFRQPERARSIPLDVNGTTFQKRVWSALQEIPAGETRTYSGLAASLRNPAATRAVARACATNRVSVIIPCHRVLGVTGSLTGYRWGKQRKAALLEAERQYTGPGAEAQYALFAES